MKTQQLVDHPFAFGRMHQKLRRGLVWCVTCGTRKIVDPVTCISGGWPSCCGYTMTVDSPTERGAK